MIRSKAHSQALVNYTFFDTIKFLASLNMYKLFQHSKKYFSCVCRDFLMLVVVVMCKIYYEF